MTAAGRMALVAAALIVLAGSIILLPTPWDILLALGIAAAIAFVLPSARASNTELVIAVTELDPGIAPVLDRLDRKSVV